MGQPPTGRKIKVPPAGAVGDASRLDLPRTVILAVTGAILVIAAWEAVVLWRYIGDQHALGTDLDYYRGIAQRWLDTGSFYLPQQLAGPYVNKADVHVLYPPIALLLFVPFTVLPWLLWWLVPLGTIAWFVLRWRPAPWTWPMLAFLAAWPTELAHVFYGNSTTWAIAAVAGGLAAGWPGAFVILKPSLAPFALVGIRRRSWWLAAVFFGMLSVVMLPLWQDFLTAIRNSDVGPTYSLSDLPPMLLPVVAWLGRRPGGIDRLMPALRRAMGTARP
ncbi:MAG: hypothetical protein ACHQ01_03605 [Candidatus Limnocylindrales bacterium]